MKNKILALLFFAAFISSCVKNDPKPITYPNLGAYGLNLLNSVDESFIAGTASLAVNIPEGESIKIMIIGDGWTYELPQSNSGFNVYGNVFTSNSSTVADFKIIIKDNPSPKNITLVIWENGSNKITWQKNILLK
jgi:hypothetical protein